MRGTSLIEAVVYIAILTVLAAMAVNTLLLINASLAELRATRALNSAAAVAVERMVRVIRDGETASVVGGTLTVTWPDGATYAFAEGAGDVLQLTAGGSTLDLTPQRVKVTGLSFATIDAGTSDGVKIVLTLEASSGRATKTQSFYATVVLRNSYAQ